MYVDTSALAKLYVPEPWSDEVEAVLVGRRDVMVSDLAVTELTSALARRVRDDEVSPADARRVYQRVLRDLESGEFQRGDLTAGTHREAERLLLAVGSRTTLRAADALHLALAGLLGARVFLTFDKRMSAAAEALGTLELPARNLV